MGRLLSLHLLLMCIVPYITMAHEQVVHRYVVREAYRLVRIQLGFDIPTMVDHVGNNETGSGAFNPGGLLVIGAHREDEEDIVWHYGIHTTATYTHFWDPDNGDGSHCCAQPTNICYENAYDKARKFLYGGWESEDEEIKRFRIQASIGTPFLFNFGFRYMFTERYFGELELPLILRFLIHEGNFSVSGGIRAPASEHSGSKSRFSGEALITVGNTQIFFGPSGLYVGGAIAGNMETYAGVVLFLRIGGAYFPSGFGSGLLALGIAWSF